MYQTWHICMHVHCLISRIIKIYKNYPSTLSAHPFLYFVFLFMIGVPLKKISYTTRTDQVQATTGPVHDQAWFKIKIKIHAPANQWYVYSPRKKKGLNMFNSSFIFKASAILFEPCIHIRTKRPLKFILIRH